MRINEIYPRMVGTCSRRRPRTGRTNAARRVVWPNDDARDDALPRPGSGPRAASIERISGPPAVNVGRMRTAQPGRATPTTSCPSRLRAGCLWGLGPPSSVCGQSYRPVNDSIAFGQVRHALQDRWRWSAVGDRIGNVTGLYLEGIRDGSPRRAVTKYTGCRYTQHSTCRALGRHCRVLGLDTERVHIDRRSHPGHRSRPHERQQDAGGGHDPWCADGRGDPRKIDM